MAIINLAKAYDGFSLPASCLTCYIFYTERGGMFDSVRYEIRFQIAKLKRSDVGDAANVSAVRKDLTVIPIQPNVCIHVYWKVLKIGKGPALTFNIHGQELLKFDCFGPEKGHYHKSCDASYRARGLRVHFFEKSVEQQIDRSIFELTKNIKYHLQGHPWNRIQTMKLDRKALRKACLEAREIMLMFHRTVPELNS